MESDYKAKLEVFEGPLDLLLYLIKKEEVDVFDIPIERVTNQYMEYLALMKLLNLELAGEFVVMAATLMYIKSRMLLPEDQQVTDTEADEGEDPRWELIRQLVEYKKFKDAALQLGRREEEQSRMFPRQGVDDLLTDATEEVPLADVSIFDLINAFNSVLKKATEREDFREIVRKSSPSATRLRKSCITCGTGRTWFSPRYSPAPSRARRWWSRSWRCWS
jgi:segregation and condensation protein A